MGVRLWRAVIKLGGYEVVTTSKLWRQVGSLSTLPSNGFFCVTCTTVSWTFRNFYEKALLEYEKHKRQIGELQLPGSPVHQSISANAKKRYFFVQTNAYQPPGSGRERRVAATRAMQGWHAQRLVGYGEISEPIIKDKNLNSATKREKPLKSIGIHKQRAINVDPADKHESNEADKELVAEIVDIGPPANWVKINVHETKDCYEVYALVPGLLREEVRNPLEII
ncbi:hypothetical protein K2173_027879 [Erythroxylum novogranatense]|uniref:ARID domain-containing protein n=1 Tax=Erythroxylum novogranatense TaxID=1862640 RepID=A0AAV8U068_9ROSI|nr:hypothetical protein K2173_027879 [Erythroxylum novogranatense]